MKTGLVCITTFFVIVSLFVISKYSSEHTSTKAHRLSVSFRTYKHLKPSVHYKDSIPPLHIEHLTMIGTEGIYGVDGIKGKLLRSLRFQNITDAVEWRYNLPRHTILAMVMEESSGIEDLPNALGDGGFGLCHMQPPVAQEFGLVVYQNCTAMICNGKHPRSCKDERDRLCNHASDLKKIVAQYKTDRRVLIGYDERLNRLLNLDAVGRMLASHMDGPAYGANGPFHTAILRYAGTHNYKAYWRDVRRNMKALVNKKLLAALEQEFNALNPNLTINGEPADFDRYIALSQEQNYNYGLAQYMALPLYLPRNSDTVLATLGKF